MKNNKISLYNYESNVENLGPGKRFVIWVQGCSFKCSNCIVPDSWDIKKGTNILISDLINLISKQKSIDGLTISGGEPFEQPLSILKLINEIKKFKSDLSIMIYTGYTLSQLNSFNSNIIDKILDMTDILIDDLYKVKLSTKKPWIGSTNQTIYFLSSVYDESDYIFASKQHNYETLYISSESNISYTGVTPKNLSIRSIYEW